MRKLSIIRGNSGSGKTTVAKELQNRFGRNTMLISQDMIRREVLKVNDGENMPAIFLMKELLKYGNIHSKVIILDGIMYADWHNSLFQLAIELYDSKIHAYYFDLPFEEALTRHKTKAICHEFGEEEMRKWWREKGFSDILHEVSITSEERGVENIYNVVLNGKIIILLRQWNIHQIFL